MVAEASVARMPISTGAENTFRYGIVEVTGTLVAGEDQAGVGWPYVQGRLFGGDLTMTIAYRVTVMSRDLRRLTARFGRLRRCGFGHCW